MGKSLIIRKYKLTRELKVDGIDVEKLVTHSDTIDGELTDLIEKWNFVLRSRERKRERWGSSSSIENGDSRREIGKQRLLPSLFRLETIYALPLTQGSSLRQLLTRGIIVIWSK